MHRPPYTFEQFTAAEKRLDQMMRGARAVGSHSESDAILAYALAELRHVTNCLQSLDTAGQKAALTRLCELVCEPVATRAEATKPLRLGISGARHLYRIGAHDWRQPGRPVVAIEVDADSRPQACRIAAQAGFDVRDCNMIG